MTEAATKKAATRIYVVTTDGANPRLVRATSTAQATAYTARKTFVATLATQDQLLDMAGKLTVEEAVETPEPAAS